MNFKKITPKNNELEYLLTSTSILRLHAKMHQIKNKILKNNKMLC